MTTYITGWVLKYRCFNCKYTALVEIQTESINGINRILALGANFVECPNCSKDTFRMVSANIQRCSSQFGDSEGVWKCPNHFDSYYPIPIKRAFDIVNGRTTGVVMEQYKEIAQLGFPLACPKCSTPMQYYRGAYHLGHRAF